MEKKVTPKGQEEPIRVSEIYLLEKTLKEYRSVVEANEETVMLRHKLKMYHEILSWIMKDGIQVVIEHFREKYLSEKLKQQIKEEVDDDDTD